MEFGVACFCNNNNNSSYSVCNRKVMTVVILELHFPELYPNVSSIPKKA
jgi:hypothetical protein